METIQVKLEESVIAGMDTLVKSGMYKNKEELVLSAVRDKLYEKGIFPPKPTKRIQ